MNGSNAGVKQERYMELHPHFLTHLPLDDMAAILADEIFKSIILNENVRISTQIPLKFVPKGSIDTKPALVQVMDWRRIGNKPLPEAKLTQFINAYMRPLGGLVNDVEYLFLSP